MTPLLWDGTNPKEAESNPPLTHSQWRLISTHMETTAQTPAKARKLAFTVLDDGGIRAEFGEGLDPLYFYPDELPSTLTHDAITEGIVSRLRGFAANVEDRTSEKLRAAVERGIGLLKEGLWRAERVSAEEYTIEEEAAHLFRVMRAESEGKAYGGTLADDAEAFSSLSDEKKKELKTLPRYRAAYAQVKAERQARTAAKLASKVNGTSEEMVF